MCVYFNPRSRKGSDVPFITRLENKTNFNPRSRKGSDDCTSMVLNGSCQFQSTLPQGERLLPAILHPCLGIISIHAPARGATKVSGNTITVIEDFNPRSRKGSDRRNRKEYICHTVISIHAPARGATMLRSVAHTSILISIHAPARGATLTV